MSLRHAPVDGYDIECDFCGEVEWLDSGEDFRLAVSLAKEAGWKSRKDVGGNWENICPECVEKEKP